LETRLKSESFEHLIGFSGSKAIAKRQNGQSPD